MIRVQPVTLQGNGVRLEPLSMDHANGLSEAAADGELWKLFFTFVPHPNEVADYIRSALNGQSNGHMLPWVVKDVAFGEVIGATRFHDILPTADRVEIGYTWYSERFQRTHVNTACKLLLLEYAFEKVGCGVVGFRTDCLNLKSQRAIESLGAKKDGVLRHHSRRKDGSFRDDAFYSILRTEWPAVQQHLQTRLWRRRKHKDRTQQAVNPSRSVTNICIAIVGEYDPTFPPHAATEAAVVHSASLLQLDVQSHWLSTSDIDEQAVKDYDAIWIAPGSPYKDMARTVWLIQQARERKMPCLGTCGGFQHMVIEYARNVLGVHDAQHAEYDPYASKLIISRLACSLVGKKMSISLAAGSRVAGFYGTAATSEEYYCNFAVNPEYTRLLADSDFRIVGSDIEGDARVMEISSHPFFVGTLFVPQARSTKDSPHPLVTAFIQAARQCVMAEQGGQPERRAARFQ